MKSLESYTISTPPQPFHIITLTKGRTFIYIINLNKRTNFFHTATSAPGLGGTIASVTIIYTQDYYCQFSKDKGVQSNTSIRQQLSFSGTGDSHQGVVLSGYKPLNPTQRPPLLSLLLHPLPLSSTYMLVSYEPLKIINSKLVDGGRRKKL